MLNASLFSSKNHAWATPRALFDSLNAEFGPFELDPCASVENAKCERFFTKEQDGLKQEWAGKVFMNPPYGREIGAWVKKAFESAKRGGGNGCLLVAGSYGHCLVARLLRQGRRAVPARPRQVRGCDEFRAVSKCNCGV